eukprot:8133758-Pyramimonas_sp.AAC.1
MSEGAKEWWTTVCPMRREAPLASSGRHGAAQAISAPHQVGLGSVPTDKCLDHRHPPPPGGSEYP